MPPGTTSPQAQNRNRKIVLYAGIAGAVVALVIILKKKESKTEEEGTLPTYASAPSAIPATGETGEGVQLRNELSSFESTLQNQLPSAISSAVEAGIRANTPTTAPQSNLGEALTGIASILGAVMQNRTGEQVGGGSSGSTPSQGTTNITINTSPTGTNVKTPAAGPSKPKCPGGYPTSGPHGCYRDGKCPNGCQGHFYQNGTTECQRKVGKTCTW
jgi:hypothetical protein